MSLTLQQRIIPLTSDLDTPVGLYLRLAGEGPGLFLESAEVDGRWGRSSIIALDFVLTAVCRQGRLELRLEDERLRPLLRHHGKPFMEGLRGLLRDLTIAAEPDADLPPITRACYGYLGYGVAGMLEPKLAACLPPEKAEAGLVLPGSLVYYDHVYNRLSRLTLTIGGEALTPLPPEEHAPQPAREANALDGETAYTGAVRRVKELIRQGELIQAVLSTTFSAPLRESPFAIYRRLRQLNPSPYMFYMRFQEGTLLGSSPEVLVSCTQGRLRLCPIAGTRPRGADAAGDERLAADLLADPKERAEHTMLVDLGRNDLGRVAEPGSVSVDRLMDVERFSHVMHLTSRISARLRQGLDAVDLLGSVFPAGTVSGAPKVRAMEIVAGEEQGARGPYAGAVGWIGLDAGGVNLDMGITIRSLWVRDGQVRWQAGAGIVHDSVPEAEWNECRNKAAVIRHAVLGDAS